MPTASLKIFVVDDERMISDTLAAILNRNGFDATGYSNPVLALQEMEAFAPDLVISDLSMPYMSGLELGIEINAKYPSCKVVLFSGQAATSHLMMEASQQGHNFTLLTKPLHPRDLLDAIRREMSVTSRSC
jgi:DNA-binding NtrC family response regulator